MDWLSRLFPSGARPHWTEYARLHPHPVARSRDDPQARVPNVPRKARQSRVSSMPPPRHGQPPIGRTAMRRNAVMLVAPDCRRWPPAGRRSSMYVKGS